MKTRAHMPEYRMRCTTLDREISFKEKGLWFHGKAVGIDDDGGLVVDTHNGIKVLNTGEITVR